MKKETIGRKILNVGIPVLACAMALALTPTMKAATITYTLTEDGCTNGCGSGSTSFGTIQLTDNGMSGTAAAVSVLLTLNTSGVRFAGGGAGDALEFNVAGAVTITGITSGFGIGPAPDSASTFGAFLHSVTCTACTGGQSTNPSGPLSFTVGSATGVTISSFTANTGGYFFASDIVGSNNGNTGNVAALGTTATPEPISSALVGGGLLSLFLLRRRASK